MPIMTSSEATLIKAGPNVSADLLGTGSILMDAASMVNTWISGAESTINVLTRINYSDTYSTLNADVAELLNDVASSLAAINCIQYDMSGYTSRGEAESMINVLRDGALRGLSLLKDKKQTDFVDNA